MLTRRSGIEIESYRKKEQTAKKNTHTPREEENITAQHRCFRLMKNFRIIFIVFNEISTIDLLSYVLKIANHENHFQNGHCLRKYSVFGVCWFVSKTYRKKAAVYFSVKKAIQDIYFIYQRITFHSSVEQTGSVNHNTSDRFFRLCFEKLI